jgi:sugar phosphate isomerase/epimerase
MKLAINGQQLAATHPLPKLLDLLEQFGVKAVELWPANLPGGGDAEANERFETRDVSGTAALLRERGFEVACVTLGFWAAPLCFARGGGPAFTEALRGAVEAAEQFGAGLVNTYNVGIPLSIWGAAVAPVAAYAATKGIVITLENEAHDESGLPQNVAALCERLASPGFGTQFDPCNYYHAGVEPFPAAYELIRPHVRYVHLKGGARYNPALEGMHKGSTMRDSERDHIGYLRLPDAAFNVAGIVRRLERDGYDGFVTLEPHVASKHIPSFYAQEVPYLRALLGNHSAD